MKNSVDQRPSMSSPARSAPRKGLLALYFGVSLFAIFYLPYFFPVAPSASDSYIFGYNNRVGIILLLLFVSVGATWTKGLNFNFNTTGPSSKIPLKYLWLILSIEFAACAAMYYWIARFRPIGESAYEINRVWMLSLGKAPYVDFEWTYGSAFLYISAWFSSFFHLTIPQGYALCWGSASLLSVILIFATVNLVDLQSRHRTFIFCLFSLCTVFPLLSFCAVYTFLRYVLPLFFILLLYNVSRRGAQWPTKLYAGGLAVAFTLILILISPEMAIAYAFACVVLLSPVGPPFADWKRVAVYLATITAIALLFLVAFKFHVLDGVRAAGKGISSLPLTFAPATLMFFCTVFICACYVAQRASHNGIQDNTIALIVFSLPAIASALSRCDPGHILTSGMGFFIAALFYASASPRMWKIYCTAFIVLVISPCTLLSALFFPGLLGTSALPIYPASSDPLSLYPAATRTGDGLLETPFSYEPNARGFYFSSQIDYGYFDGNADLATPDAIQRKLDELALHPKRSLLLPGKVLGICDTDQGQRRVYLSILLFSPYTAKAVHSESVLKPLCSYIREHYVIAVPADPQNFQYDLWKPNM